MQKRKIKVNNAEIVLFEQNKMDFISLTDIARYKDAERSDYIVQNWMRNYESVEFLGLWERINNKNFNSIEFDGFVDRCD
ncbi:MAG: KilA, /APSES-type HTH DNA-binding domain-containing protein [Candidatus Moranbacteria bacterium GW2011_GWE2_36_40]|nr:MAG: KilA, /APSES-type HTH DNA-binding domain-containing protein [Candidatus Moranbacteria bacterium GW2011_GWE2_36_40]